VRASIAAVEKMTDESIAVQVFVRRVQILAGRALDGGQRETTVRTLADLVAILPNCGSRQALSVLWRVSTLAIERSRDPGSPSPAAIVRHLVSLPSPLSAPELRARLCIA